MVISKTDLAKTDLVYYKAKQDPQIVDLDSYYYLSVSGQSSPEDKIFLNAIEMLYAVAYAIKFICKSEDNDFVVPKMEGFWWITGGAEAQKDFVNAPREEWYWRIVIRMPDFVEETIYFRAMEQVKNKKPELAEVEKVKYELINEGLSAQILHLGSYEEETPTIEKLHTYIKENGYEINGRHHEIYLSDPRKTAPEKLKTILRYSVN